VTPVFSTPERVAVLLRVAAEWAGTRYVPDGAIKGSGVSCAMLPYVIITEAVAALGIDFDFPAPPKRGQMKKCELLPAMVEWLTAREGTHFERLVWHGDAAAGDLILFDAGIGHAALCVGPGKIIHSWQAQGAHFTTYRVPRLAERIVGVWSPVAN
jgi:cell wall-associated NlpC family hydrolase